MSFGRAASIAALLSFASVACGAELEPIAATMETIRQQMLREFEAFGSAPVTPAWLKDGNRFLYTRPGPGEASTVLVDPANGRITSLDAASLKAAQADLAESDPDARPRVISDQFPTTFGDLIEARSPDGRRFITVRDANLFVRSAGSDELRALTSDGTDRLTWLNTQESAQSFNVFWSPDSRSIAAVQLDTADTWHEPLPHWLGARPESSYVAYPRAGEPMHRFRLAIIDVDTGERIAIETGDTTDHYVDLLGWRGDGRAVLYQTIDREHKRLQVFAADARTGKPTLLMSESRTTYLDTPMTLGIRFVFPLERANGFLYLSERDDWRHIYLYDGSGKLQRQLTRGAWPVSDVVAIDERRGWIYFRASRNAAAPYHLQLFRVSMRGGEPQRLTDGSGVHRIAMSPSKSYFIAERSSSTEAPVVELRGSDGRLISVLAQAESASLVAAGYSGIEPFATKSTDGRWDMHGIIIRPRQFDANKRYPVVEIIYGGMQMANTPHGFYPIGGKGSVSLLRTLANAGFVVVAVDAPGTPGRGKVFQDVTYGIWPQSVIGNHAHWIEAAARSRPWMDLQRVGVYGHSWGAYMAQRAMIEAPHLYKVAAGHAGPSDFVDHPTYIEPFMGLPKHNPRGYGAASNLTRIDAIRGPVLVMTMPLDVNAGFSPGMKFYDAMVRAGKDVELVVFPESNHRMNCCGPQRELYGIATVQRWFRRHLHPEAAVAPK